MEIKKRRTRMYEPWGYRDENNYQGTEIIHENELDSFFAETSYNKDDNKIHFFNKDGEEKASIDVSEFVKSDSIIERTEYVDGILKIYFTNGDVITVDLTELIDENEFKDGLIIDDHAVKVLVDSTSEPYLSVSENGVKVSGIDAAIQVETDRATAAETVLDEKIEAETARATSAETELDEKISAEEARALSAETVLDDKIEAETARATSAETELKTALNAEITRATHTEEELNYRIDVTNDELNSEESRAQAAEQELRTLLTNEIADRKADVDAEEARAISAETVLDSKIAAETTRALSAETVLDDKIAALRQSLNEEIERATAKEEELEGNDITSGNMASDATISITKNNGEVITFTSAEQIDLEAGEF